MYQNGRLVRCLACGMLVPLGVYSLAHSPTCKRERVPADVVCDLKPAIVHADEIEMGGNSRAPQQRVTFELATTSTASVSSVTLGPFIFSIADQIGVE